MPTTRTRCIRISPDRVPSIQEPIKLSERDSRSVAHALLNPPPAGEALDKHLVNEPRIQPFESRFDRTAFSCGEPSLDGYIREQASQDQRRNLARCFILLEPDANRVTGYYTLSTTSVQLTSLPDDIAKKLGKYSRVSAAIIGRLAVDEGYKGRRLGEQLLIEALSTIVELSVSIGIALTLSASPPPGYTRSTTFFASKTLTG